MITMKIYPHCPGYPIAQQELDWYQDRGYFKDMKVGDMLYAPSQCACYQEDKHECDCELAELRSRLIRHEDVLVCDSCYQQMMAMEYPLEGFIRVSMVECEFHKKAVPVPNWIFG